MTDRLATTRRPCALIVDSYPDTRDLYVTAFSSGGFDVAVAGEAGEIPERIAFGRPDVIVADVKSAAAVPALMSAAGGGVSAGVPLIIVGADVHAAGPVAHTLTAAILALQKPCLPDMLVWQAQQLLGMAASNAVVPGARPEAEAITLWHAGEFSCSYRARQTSETSGFLEVRRGDGVIWREAAPSTAEARARSDRLRLMAERGLL